MFTTDGRPVVANKKNIKFIDIILFFLSVLNISWYKYVQININKLKKT
jgi:hypothetical protein